MPFRNTIFFDIFLLLLVIAFGTAGYMVIEHWNFLDAVYMTIITVTTIGYGEIHTLDGPGRIFTIILIILGIGTITYTLGSISSFIFRGSFYTFLQKQAMDKKIERLSGHYIICGASDTNLVIMKELTLSQVPFVLIEQEEAKIKNILTALPDCLYIQGDATSDVHLQKAQVASANGLIASLGDDHDEIYLIMAAREMNKNLKIYARVNQESSRKKFLLAGANFIINPYEIGGMRIASLILRPGVVKFLEDMANDPKNLRIEEMVIDDQSPLANKTIDIDDLQRQIQARLITVKKAKDHSYQYHFPKKQVPLQAGDCLFVLQAKENGNT